jgi:hypothetical protein
MMGAQPDAADRLDGWLAIEEPAVLPAIAALQWSAFLHAAPSFSRWAMASDSPCRRASRPSSSWRSASIVG